MIAPGDDARNQDRPVRGAHVMETPSIADKVQFWEEQDRINKELIPRVIKIHELFTDHIAGHEEASTQIAAAEARMIQRANGVRMQGLAVGAIGLAVAAVALVLSLVV